MRAVRRTPTAAREPLQVGGASVRIGTASWTDPTMTAAGVFYPPDATTAEDRLVYYANQFPIVEVDATYYALPARRTGELWLERTPPDFTFDIKAHALMTGQPSEVARLPKDLREELPAELLDKKRVYARDLPNEIEDEIWARFLDGIAPLHSAGKLGAVFLQYPRWFFPTSESRDEIVKARERLRDVPMAVELRHASWFNEKNAERTDRFPREVRDPVRHGRRAARDEVLAAADDRRHLAEAGGGPLPRPSHRDLGGHRAFRWSSASATCTTRASSASGCRAFARPRRRCPSCTSS